MKLFQAFLRESYHDNHTGILSETIEALRTLIGRRFVKVTKENDSRILLAIAQKFLLKNILFVSDVELSDELTHIRKAFVIVGDKYLDSSGLYDKSKLMQKAKLNQSNFSDKTFVGTISTMMKFCELDKHPNPLSTKEQSELHAFIDSFYEQLHGNLGEGKS